MNYLFIARLKFVSMGTIPENKHQSHFPQNPFFSRTYYIYEYIQSNNVYCTEYMTSIFLCRLYISFQHSFAINCTHVTAKQTS